MALEYGQFLYRVIAAERKILHVETFVPALQRYTQQIRISSAFREFTAKSDRITNGDNPTNVFQNHRFGAAKTKGIHTHIGLECSTLTARDQFVTDGVIRRAAQYEVFTRGHRLQRRVAGQAQSSLNRQPRQQEAREYQQQVREPLFHLLDQNKPAPTLFTPSLTGLRLHRLADALFQLAYTCFRLAYAFFPTGLRLFSDWLTPGPSPWPRRAGPGRRLPSA